MSDKQAWDELYVDLDDDRGAAIFMVAFKRLNEHFVQRLGHPMSSKKLGLDGGRSRMIVKLPRPAKSVHERHLLQACLGSSLHSELLAWIYLEEGKAGTATVTSVDGDSENVVTLTENMEPRTFIEGGLPFDMAAEPEDLPFK